MRAGKQCAPRMINRCVDATHMTNSRMRGSGSGSLTYLDSATASSCGFPFCALELHSVVHNLLAAPYLLGCLSPGAVLGQGVAHLPLKTLNAFGHCKPHTSLPDEQPRTMMRQS